jgi:hypothetical protein
MTAGEKKPLTKRGDPLLTETMVWLGAALMAWNVYRYIRFGSFTVAG